VRLRRLGLGLAQRRQHLLSKLGGVEKIQVRDQVEFLEGGSSITSIAIVR
jgi:hypothetical protein